MLEVQGIRSILMHGKMIKNVSFVLNLGMNILLVIQIVRKGYTFEFNLNSWSIRKGFSTLIKGSVKNELYILDQVPSFKCLF